MNYAALLTIIAIIMNISIKSSIASEPSSLPASSRQLIVVITPSWNDLKARMYRFERPETVWQKLPGYYDAVVGGKGMGWGLAYRGITETDPVKKEGDRKAPAGVFSLIKAMGYASTAPVGAGFPYDQIADNHHCVDDTDSRYYNRIVKESSRPSPAAGLWKSSEIMKRKDDLYKWLIVVDHNVKDPQPGAGSCIFIHVWRAEEKGTAGCTAMAEKDVVELISWLNNNSNPILVQLPRPIYEQYWKKWNLPPLALF